MTSDGLRYGSVEPVRLSELFSPGKNSYSTDYGGSELLYAASEGQPRHVDLLWPFWNILDLMPEGRGTDSYPKLEYA